MDRMSLESAANANTYLRGFLAVPLALLCFLAALGNWSVGPFRHDWVVVVGLLVIGGAYLLISGYYNDTYGRATPSPQQQRRLIVATLASVVVMVGVSTVLRGRAPWSLDLPVNPVAVAFAIVLFISFSVTGGVKRHHIVILGVLAIAGLMPIWRGGDPSNVGLVMTGTAILLIGFLDHMLLVRTFGSTSVQGNDGRV